MVKLKGRGIKKAHFHTKKDTLQRLEADLHVTQAIRMYDKFIKMAILAKYSPFTPPQFHRKLFRFGNQSLT